MVMYTADDIKQKNLGFAIGGLAASLVEEQMQELRSDFPNYRNWICMHRVVETCLVVTFQSKDSGIPVVGEVAIDEANEILSAAGSKRRYGELRDIPDLKKYFSREKLLFIVDLSAGQFEWDVACQYVLEWLNELAVPFAIDMNQARIARAVPIPPQYSYDLIFRSLWVLECEEAMIQGSAFALAGLGLVTCQHVVSEARSLEAFHPSNPGRKFDATIRRSNAIVDAAILDVSAELDGALLRMERQSNVTEHALVCGFPNYRIGDKGVFSPGVIVGTRQKSGIRRLLTNAPIVKGMSGGPAVGPENRVIGICVTGADRFDSADNTEDKAIVPIDALELF